MSAKPALRKIVREKIARLTPAEIAEKSARLCEFITRLPEWKSARIVCLFAPLPGEPDVELLEMEGRTVGYPRVKGVELDLFYVSGPRGMEPSRGGIRGPRADATHAADPREIDLILVPGIAFSRGGGAPRARGGIL